MPGDGDSPYLFVYGTLRRDADHVMASVLREGSTRIGRAHFQGQLYRVRWYPAAIPSKNSEDRVIGDLFAIDPDASEGLFARLDEYEGTQPEAGRSPYYRRERHAVFIENGHCVEAWIYLYNRSVKELEQIDSGDFLNSRK